MMTFRRDKKEEEDGGGNPFANIEKTAVLQEARTFNETPVNPRKCTHTLTKILYLLNQGEQLGVTEATEAFFAITKLFQSRDVILRRMVYLGIKELSGIAENVIIVTSSLTKDMTGKEDLYRAAAIRALCSITDVTMLQSIERYMKQAIVDRNPAVSSAALVSSLHFTKVAGDVVKRWVNEAQEAVTSDNIMVQYHALGVLYHIRKQDRLAVTKLVAKLTLYSPNSPYAVCLLIRIASKLLEEEESGNESPLFKFIKSCLGHKSDMISYEAARAIVNMKRKTEKDLTPVVTTLVLFCNSSKPTLRFAAVRTLNMVAMTHPVCVSFCNMELETLKTDPNRSIATLAITTLLKTSAESSVERLMKQIATFVSEISDEFKIVVVQAIRALCLKFPRKHTVLMNFLSAMLRDEGGLDYKAAIADTIITIIEDNPEAKETGLAHLCEFIEDCEHTSLAVKILHLLGKEGPQTKQPSRYIRFIYNRVILESAPVRAAAVAAMAQFGALCHDLRPNIQVLLERCQMDTDDEVRDRATYYHSILSFDNPSLTSRYIVDSLQEMLGQLNAVSADAGLRINLSKMKIMYNDMIRGGNQVSISGLEKALHQYTLTHCEEPFDMSAVPVANVDDSKNKQVSDPLFLTPVVPANVSVTREESFSEKLAGVEELSVISGQLFKSSDTVELTESETEYVIKCVKHSFPNYLVLQFDVMNTLNDQLLENVRVSVEPADGFKIVREVSIPKLPYSETGHCYVALQYPDDIAASVASFGATMKFIVKDCDPATGVPDADEGYQDEYRVEDVEVTLADQVQKVTKANFGLAWEEASTYHELEDTYSLSSVKTLEEAVTSIVSFLGMAVAEKSDKVQEGKSAHTLYLTGVFRGGHQILVRAKLAVSDGVTMQLTIRSTDREVAELVTSAIG